MNAPSLGRGGLTINPFVFLLFLVLIVLAVWQAWQLLDIASNAPPSAYSTGNKVGIVMGCTLGVLIATAIAGGVGAGMYFVTGRSELAANLGIGIVMLLACGAYGFSNYLIATRPPPAAANTGVQPPAPSPTSLRNEAAELMASQQRAMREQADAVKNWRPGVGAGAPPSSTPSPRGTAAGTPVPQAPQPAPPPPSPVSNPEEERKAKAALDPVRDEMNAKVTAFLAEATPLAESLAKPPKALRSDLDARASSTAALEGKADELEGYLRSIDGRAESALKAAGLDLSGQIRQKIVFAQSIDAFAKANACGAYKRLFDAGLEEAQALRDSAGQWRTDSAGQMISTDRSLQFRLKNLHESVQLRLRAIPEAQTTLKK